MCAYIANILEPHIQPERYVFSKAFLGCLSWAVLFCLSSNVYKFAINPFSTLSVWLPLCTGENTEDGF